MLATCEELGIGFVPWGPWGGLPDRQDRRQHHASIRRPTCAPGFPRFSARRTSSEPALRGAASTRCAKAKNATPAQIALAWLLAQKPFIVPIPGTRNIDHLEENLGTLAVDLSPAEVQRISTESAALTVHGERMDAGNMALVE